MTWLHRRWVPLSVLAAAVAALVASIAWASGTWTSNTSTWGPYSGVGSMMGGVAQPGTGAVQDMAGAARAADSFGQHWGLHVGEVMQFSRGFYAVLKDSSGNNATEVLIDEPTGTVALEYGPAMMWNTRYGMMGGSGGMMGGGMMGGSVGASTSCTVTGDQARQIANRWLKDNMAGLQAGEPDAFPGYYTLHTMRGDQITGMLSVNCGSGAVWYHSWHGDYVGMLPESR